MAHTLEPPGGPPPSTAAPIPEPASPLDVPEALQRELRPELVALRTLGRGRSGHVLLAREPRLNRLVAVKVLAPELAGNPVALARFEREARAAAALNHPNAVAVHRFGYLAGGVPYLVMQYVQGGRTLEDKLAAEGPLSVPQTRRVLAQVADALAAAHRSGFTHRDLRPANVLCDEDGGRVLVTDFGLAGLLPSAHAGDARLTQRGEVLGVPEYMSPEQLRGEEASEGSDMYALGILGYHLLAGEGPFPLRKGVAAMTAALRESPRPLRTLRAEVDEPLAQLLERCLAREPQKRPSAAFVAQALRPGLAEQDPDAASTSAAQLRGPADVVESLFRRRLPQAVAVTAVAGFAVLNFVDQLADRRVVPELLYRLSLATVAYSIAGAGVVAWFHGRPGRQRVSPPELGLLTVLGLAWLLTCLLVAAL